MYHCQARKALEPIAAELIEGGLNKEESFALAAALAHLGVEEPADLPDVDDKYARQAADAAGLKPIRANKLVKIIKSLSAPSPKVPSFSSSREISQKLSISLEENEDEDEEGFWKNSLSSRHRIF